VTILATDDVAAEAGLETGTFTITRTGPTTNPLTVLYDILGDATNGGIINRCLAASRSLPVRPVQQ
jgi:hypothetical protein